MFASPTTPQRPYIPSQAPPLKIGRVGKWYLPLMAAISLGFGITNYYPTNTKERQMEDILEKQRLEQNQKLMDAYGDKGSLRDVERAFELYQRK